MKDINLMNQQLTMSSREIATLTNKGHDNVLKVIRNLVNKDLVKSTASNYLGGNGQLRPEYRSNKRDSLVVVARLSPEFTAKVIDRWQELEDKVQQEAPEISLTDQINEITRKVKQISDAGSKWGQLGNAVKKAKRRAKGQLTCLIKEAQMELKLEFKQEVSQ